MANILDKEIPNRDDFKTEEEWDEWWMSYDCGVPSHDATGEILQSFQELRAEKRK